MVITLPFALMLSGLIELLSKSLDSYTDTDAVVPRILNLEPFIIKNYKEQSC